MATAICSVPVRLWKNLGIGSAPVSPVGDRGLFLSSFLLRKYDVHAKIGFGATPKPARETRALPFWRELGLGDHAGRDEP
jgi:hypothetical protein